MVIRHRNRINEFVTINAAISGLTRIDSDCFIMRGVHIGHDGVVEDRATLACNSIVGGHSVVQHHANLGLGAIIHQKRVVGPYCMVGMGSVVVKNIPPFMKAYGNPARVHGINILGLERGDVMEEEIEAVIAGEQTRWVKEIEETYGHICAYMDLPK